MDGAAELTNNTHSKGSGFCGGSASDGLFADLTSHGHSLVSVPTLAWPSDFSSISAPNEWPITNTRLVRPGGLKCRAALAQVKMVRAMGTPETLASAAPLRDQ